jgi:hypothetical protein
MTDDLESYADHLHLAEFLKPDGALSAPEDRYVYFRVYQHTRWNPLPRPTLQALCDLLKPPEGQCKLPHLWPVQIPPGKTVTL